MLSSHWFDRAGRCSPPIRLKNRATLLRWS
jgi:hypothetical protein